MAEVISTENVIKMGAFMVLNSKESEVEDC